MVARRYSKGRVFCMGDAVHRHPPTNGLGSNTSIRGVHFIEASAASGAGIPIRAAPSRASRTQRVAEARVEYGDAPCLGPREFD